MMKKQEKIYLILILGTLFVFSLVLKSPDCYFPEEKIEAKEPTQSSIRQVNEMLATSYVVMPTSGTSMAPTILPGQICICEKQEEYVYGDIIAFHTEINNQLYFIMHRVVNILPDGYLTKGENNPYIDNFIVSESQIFCRVRKISLFEKMINNLGGK